MNTDAKKSTKEMNNGERWTDEKDVVYEVAEKVVKEDGTVIVRSVQAVNKRGALV